ncbi:diguanylate cyclase [compost metagenome]
MAARLRQVLAQVEPVGDCRLTMSYGVVQWQEGEDQHALLARADQALYRAKGAGKNAIAE